MSTQGILGDFGRPFFLCDRKGCGASRAAFPRRVWERSNTEMRAIKKARTSRNAPFSVAVYQLPSALEASQNRPADRATVAGRVRTQASRMVLTVPPCRPLLFATM